MDVALAVAERDRRLNELAEEIAELAAHIHAATFRLLRLVAEFDDQAGWHGWKTCAHWLSWRTGIGLEAAREKVRVARALPALPAIGAAFERGVVSYSKVRAMTRVATPETEAILLQIALHGTASHVERTVRGFRRANPDREAGEARRYFEGRYLRTRHDEHGNVIVEARLPAELGERLLVALDAATDATRALEWEAGADGTDASPAGDLRSEPSILPTQRRADALLLLADSAVAAGLPGRRAADTHHVVVHVDAGVLADPAEDGRSELLRGGHVSAETSRRMACDASVVQMREDAEGTTLSVGRTRRTVPPALRRALTNRDPVCRFPGCEHRRFLEAHHVRHWAGGGETSLENLVHLCSFHHRELHEGGFRIEGRAGGDLRFVSRYGLVFEEVPSTSAAVAVERLLRDQEELSIVGRRLPVWRGDAIDYGMAVAALCSAAVQTRGESPFPCSHRQHRAILSPGTDDEGRGA